MGVFTRILCAAFAAMPLAALQFANSRSMSGEPEETIAFLTAGPFLAGVAATALAAFRVVPRVRRFWTYRRALAGIACGWIVWLAALLLESDAIGWSAILCVQAAIVHLPPFPRECP